MPLASAGANSRLGALARAKHRRGAALVEFAFIALAFYLLFAGTIEVGRMVFSLQTLQNAARVGARELAQIELPATATFDQALADPLVRETVYDPGLLVLETEGMDDVTFQQRIDGFPALNKMLSPLMIRERLDIGAGEREYFHYPGAIVRLTNPGLFSPYTVVIPRVIARDSDGVETIDWVEVVEEVRPEEFATDPSTAPFSMVSTGRQRGLVALRVNYPYQAASMSGYLHASPSPGGSVNTAVLANDSAVQDSSGPPPGTELTNQTGGNQTYSGRFGLGVQFALGHAVRPYRRLLSGQSMFRREVFSR